MSLLTDYLLWKSMKHKTLSSLDEHVNIKQEDLLNKQEIFDNDMICRVCTSPADISITDKIDGILIISAIRSVANISINEADYYPKYICKICLGELKIAFLFKKKCEASDMTFRKAISSETLLVAGSQPMVMHDFSLILHQMKEKRPAIQNIPIKQNKIDDDEFYNEEMVDSPLSENIQDVNSCTNDNQSRVKKKIKQISSVKDTTTHNCIISMITNGAESSKNDSCIDANILVNTRKKLGKKLLRVPKCKRCDIPFETKEELQRHRKQNNCVYHPCPLCGKLVLNLASHEKIVHLRSNKYTCDQCGKIYYSSGALKNHMHIHNNTKEYFCEHCPYRGRRKSYLVCHMRVHTGEHRYLCAMCPLKFTNPSNLNKHQLIHFNKKFECSKCKRLFRQERHLKEHFDAAHLNIRYRCSICGRDLSSRKKLLSHELRVHKREKHKLFEEVQKVVISNDND